MRSSIPYGAACFIMTVICSPQLLADIVSEDSSIGVLETVPPSTGTLDVPGNAAISPVPLPYSGVSDAENAIAEVVLWYRADGEAWQTSGLSSTASAGTFHFTPPGAPPSNFGIYHFQLVVEDDLGNSSPVPTGASGSGQGSTNFELLSNVGDWWMLQ